MSYVIACKVEPSTSFMNFQIFVSVPTGNFMGQRTIQRPQRGSATVPCTSVTEIHHQGIPGRERKWEKGESSVRKTPAK